MSKPTLGSVAESGFYQLTESLWAGSVKLEEITIEWVPEIQALGNEYLRWKLQQAQSKSGLHTEIQNIVYAAWVPGVVIWRQEYRGWTYEQMDGLGMDTGDYSELDSIGDDSSARGDDVSISAECLERVD